MRIRMSRMTKTVPIPMYISFTSLAVGRAAQSRFACGHSLSNTHGRALG